jgi:peptidoglycan/xylan/chitin deacetylase (PgdA/CDA1 family)
MTPSATPNSAFSLLEQAADSLSLVTFDWLAALGRGVLPAGYWGEEDGAEKALYLTFDDGPCPHTSPRLLELLEEEEVPATFFQIGANIERLAHLIRPEDWRRHSIGSHSFSHQYFPLLKTNQIEQEIVSTNALIEKAFGVKPALFRAPYGILDQRAADFLKDCDMRIIYWGAVPQDWLPLGAARVSERVTRRLAPGKIIVLHEGKAIAEQTISSTREIIKRAKAQGFEFKALK